MNLPKAGWRYLIDKAEGFMLTAVADGLQRGEVETDIIAKIDLGSFLSGGIREVLFGSGTSARLHMSKDLQQIDEFFLSVLQEVGSLIYNAPLSNNRQRVLRVRNGTFAITPTTGEVSVGGGRATSLGSGSS